MSEAKKRLRRRPGHEHQASSPGAESALLALAACLVLTLCAARWQVVEAQGTISRCEPEWAIAATSQQATVCIYVQDVAELYGVDFEMSFPGMVGVAEVVDEDPIFSMGVQIMPNSTFMSPPWYFTFNEADNATGYLHYLVTELSPSEPKTGSGPIACMRFDPSGPGDFYLTFTRHQLSTIDGFLISNTANTCRVTFYDPTNVVVSGFEAEKVGPVTHIQWETASEMDLVGFNLYRATKPNGPRTQVNEDLIPTLAYPGSLVGAVYEYEDMPIERNASSFYYWLEAVDIYGHTTLHDPVKAKLIGRWSIERPARQTLSEGQEPY